MKGNLEWIEEIDLSIPAVCLLLILLTQESSDISKMQGICLATSCTHSKDLLMMIFFNQLQLPCQFITLPEETSFAHKLTNHKTRENAFNK